MNRLLVFLILNLTAVLVPAQVKDSPIIGFAINSSFNSELYPVRVVPSISYLKRKSQFELGVGINPFERNDRHILSCELNHKYYPNGTHNKFNVYLVSSLSYVNDSRATYYPSIYNYLFLNGGYGLEIKAGNNIYMGTNVSAGLFSYSKKSDTPYSAFATVQMFEEFNWHLAFQFNVGYRLFRRKQT